MSDFKLAFSTVLNKQRRHIVVHDIKDESILLSKLHDGDLVFFDDCLYSQFHFIDQYVEILRKRDIVCVISYSTDIHRGWHMPIEYAECSECHRRYHSGDKTVLDAYMSIGEVFNLLSHENVYLACHGASHLDLRALSNDRLTQMKLFSDDLDSAVEELQRMKEQTSIFVYPYVYDDFPCADDIVMKHGFTHIFAGKTSRRIQIEDLHAE